jgi:molybdopterin synthase sulfur carrier subunit
MLNEEVFFNALNERRLYFDFLDDKLYIMKVRLFATLRQVAGTKEVEVDLEAGETVGHALERLVELHPNLKDQIFDETGDLQRSIIILLKGRNIRLEEGLETVLGEDDYLAIFPPVAGGKGFI